MSFDRFAEEKRRFRRWVTRHHDRLLAALAAVAHMIRRIALPLFAVMMAAVAHGAENCGEKLHTMSRFRGTIRSVRMLAEGVTGAWPVGFDLKYAVTMDIDSVEPGVTIPRQGERAVFAIHSPSRTFGTGPLVGRSFDLEALRIDCGGQFEYFSTLETRRKSQPIETFDRSLQVGHTYRMKATETKEGPKLLYDLDVPMHHGGTIHFTNDERLDEKKPVREVVFDVVALHITQRNGEWSFSSVYDAKIIAVK